MTAGAPGAEILPPGTSLRARWGYLLDNLPEEIGGGYMAGEFLLRSDGALLARPVSSLTSGETLRYRALGPWEPFRQFGPAAAEDDVVAWLGERGYDLHDPPKLAVDEDEGPELPASGVLGAV